MPDPRGPVINPDVLGAMPEAPEVERHLLGLLLDDGSGLGAVAGLVGADDFAVELYGRVFAILTDLARDGRPVNVVTVAGVLDADERAELADLVGLGGFLGDSVHYARIVAEMAARRRAIAAALQAVEAWRAPSLDFIADDVWQRLGRAVEGGRRGGAHPLGIWDAGLDDAPIPPRAWILARTFARGFISAVLGAGATGKTALRYAQLLGVAAGRSLTGEHLFVRGRVLILSLEDGRDELRRRVRAAMLHHGVTADEIAGWLWLAAPGGGAGKLMVEGERGRPVRGSLAGELERAVAENGIDLLAIDPFVKAHALEENDNSAIDDVMTCLSDLAVKHNIAIDVTHHVTKGAADPGNADRGRGASAMRDAARLVWTVSTMTADEAETLGVAAAERRQHIRLDPAKINLTLPVGDATWFRLVGVALGNGDETYPHGDTVQTVEPWLPPDAFYGLGATTVALILAEIDKGLPDGNLYSDASKAGERAAWRAVTRHSAKDEVTARRIIAAWVRHGMLMRCDYRNPVTSKPAKGLKVDPDKRPAA